jgi:hypothetical protein
VSAVSVVLASVAAELADHNVVSPHQPTKISKGSEKNRHEAVMLMRIIMAATPNAANAKSIKIALITGCINPSEASNGIVPTIANVAEATSAR